ncbi:MAG: TonB-dependent receptor [Acidobacteriaceae bacterium]|nr:TonB-dependent receptor [Acidobacteriaceae bacterium]
MFRLALSLVLAASAALAQNSAMQGVVTDASKAAISGATVTITNLATQSARTATTNAEGIYTVPLLPPGAYRVEASSAGFAPQKVNEVRLETGQTARLDFELKPGSVVESINVSASAVLINSETSEVGQVIDSKRILEMPLNGRNYLQLALFTTGVLPGGNLAAGSRARTEGAFAAVGMQIAQNNVLLDGNDNSSRTSGGQLGFEAQAVKPPVDAVTEFKVVTNNMSAEYGYRAGAKVLVSTKSGTNELHGSVYEFLRNEKLDGANFFANASGAKKPTYRQNQFGATLGGPAIKNRTFFFGSYQGTRIRTGRSFVSSVPSRDLVERFDFSQQPAIRRNVFDPLTLTGTGATAARLQFPNNVIPRSRLDPVVGRILSLYPVSNIPGLDNAPNNYFFSPSDSDDADQYDFRGDHNVSANHRFFARFSRRNQDRLENGVLPFPAAGGQGQSVVLRGNNLASSLTSTLSPSIFNDLRFGWTQFNTILDIPYDAWDNPKLGIKNAPADYLNDGFKNNGWTRFSPSGFAEMGPRSFWPNVNNINTYLFSNGTVIQRGKHSIKFGGEYRHTNQFRNASRFRRGQFAFDGRFTSQSPNVGTSRANTGNGFADMVLGWVSGGSYGTNQGEDINNKYWGIYVQDDWKISRTLTINFGLRYEVIYKATFPDPDRQGVSRYLFAGVNVANLADEKITFPKAGSCDCKNDLNNYAPRLGFAWSLTPKTVIRSGGGFFYGEPNNLGTDNANFVPGAPRATEIAIQQAFETTNIYVQQGFPQITFGTTIPRGSGISVFPDFRENLLAYQWFFDVQRTLPLDILLTVGYNGTKGSFLAWSQNINLPRTPSATVASNLRLIRPEFNAVSYAQTGQNSSYNSLAVKLEKRFAKGFTFLSSFTWSHNIDYNNEDLLDGSTGVVTPYDMRRERGNSTLDRRLAYNLSSVYELPFGKGKGRLESGAGNWLLGGWQVGAIVALYSGMPITHSINVNNQNLGGAVRGDWVRNPNLPAGERTIDRWFDLTAFTANAPGTIGNAGRNLIYGPGTKNLDLMVSRSFAMPWENHSLQFRAEAFNATNTANFGVPSTAIGTPAAGRITSAADPRRVQFALKYMF